MATTPITEQMVLDKWELLKQGQTLVVGDSWLDTAAAYFDKIDPDGQHLESVRFFRDLVTVANPNRCGVLDTYLASLRGCSAL
jgi:hypothetical protein